MVSNTHTMTLGRSKNKISQIVGTIFSPKKLTFFSVIEMKPVDILLDQMVDNMKEVNRNYVTP